MQSYRENLKAVSTTYKKSFKAKMPAVATTRAFFLSVASKP
jgi:hypothetical protein